MGQVKGYQILARALEVQGVKDFFYIMGGPMLGAQAEALKRSMRGIDVRHEQAAAMAAHAYARLLNKPGVCMAASGPGTTNLITGIAHAWADCTPVVALGGSSPTTTSGRGVFQEIDQLEMMRPCTKWSARIHHPQRIPEILAEAMAIAMSGRRGPVYVDLPGDVLHQTVEGARVDWAQHWSTMLPTRPAVSPDDLALLASRITAAQRPVIVAGSGVIWSGASDELTNFVSATGIPFFTTPQSRGVVPEDHPFCFAAARATAFAKADLFIVLGTRLNYVISHATTPRFNEAAEFVRIDLDPNEIATGRRNGIKIVADALTALKQMGEVLKGRTNDETFAPWRSELAEINIQKAVTLEKRMTPSTPIHPLFLCKEVAAFLDRDAVLCVDGQEILNFGRQSIATFVAGHRLNSGTFGTMGVGLPMGLGAKAALPHRQVVVLHGDGSFGMNAMEIDTAVRHNLPITVVISNNGGWTADPDKEKPGRDLGFTRYEKMAEMLECPGYYVEHPDELAEALASAKTANKAGKCAIVNVVTDADARASTVQFTDHST